jgi:hypothetical protein
MHLDDVVVNEHVRLRDDPSSVRQHHFAGFDQRLQDAGDVQRSLVGLIDNLNQQQTL